VDVTFVPAERVERGDALFFVEKVAKGKPQMMGSLYLIAALASPLGITGESTVKVRVEKLPKDGGFKLTVQSA
jgi:hypothetical protein